MHNFSIHKYVDLDRFSMTIHSYTVVKRELKQLRGFYYTTQRAYDRAKQVIDASESDDVLKRALTAKGLRWTKAEKKYRSDPHKGNVEAILRELIFVRAISALETFLTDVVRDVFIVTKVPFLDKSIRIEMSQEELIANNTPTKIFAKIINRETRSLTSGGFNEFIKYYKKRFNIDLAQISPGYKRMNEYHDHRHMLVHRLGQTDEVFRRKYHTDSKELKIGAEYLDSLLRDLNFFVEAVETQVSKLIQSFSPGDTSYNARYVIEVNLLKGSLPACLQPSFQYWADDEYVMLNDILLGTSPGADGRVRYYFNATDRALRHLQRRIRREQRNLLISVVEVTSAFKFEKKAKQVSEETIKLVRDSLPAQPWSKGVHKEVATRLGISNGKVSAAIDVLISRGVFKDQVHGRLIM
jgi:hypothetical protein